MKLNEPKYIEVEIRFNPMSVCVEVAAYDVKSNTSHVVMFATSDLRATKYTTTELVDKALLMLGHNPEWCQTTKLTFEPPMDMEMLRRIVS